jgi:uncharacterized membrane protein (UPF0136 family)
LVVNSVAAILGARGNTDRYSQALLTGLMLGTTVTVVGGWLLLIYRESFVWTAFVLGAGVAFGAARYGRSREPQAVSALAVLGILCLFLLLRHLRL